MLRLPRTLAAIGSTSLPLPLALQEELSDHLPLESHTTHGGWPEGARISVRRVIENESEAEILLTVDFIEQVPAACPASARPEARTTYLRVIVNKPDANAIVLDDR